MSRRTFIWPTNWISFLFSRGSIHIMITCLLCVRSTEHHHLLAWQWIRWKLTESNTVIFKTALTTKKKNSKICAIIFSETNDVCFGERSQLDQSGSPVSQVNAKHNNSNNNDNKQAVRRTQKSHITASRPYIDLAAEKREVMMKIKCTRQTIVLMSHETKTPIPNCNRNIFM